MSDARLEDTARWLLLVHQLPAKPAYLRVKVWRRLQAIGAIAVKNAVYALPVSDQAQEDFEWLLREIVQGGGEAMVCEARLVDGLSDEEVRAKFNVARDTDYDALAKEIRALASSLGRKVDPEEKADAKMQLARLKIRYSQIVSLDFFGANSRETVEGLLDELAAKLGEGAAPEGDETGALKGLKGRTWITREGVQVDRIASAWLIRRFIDPEAAFKFVPSKGYKPKPGELRFDMFQAEFTHEGDQCTFEVLVRRAGLKDPALKAIAEIVHDIDLKDGKFGRDEATGLAQVLAGLTLTHPKDADRLARGAELFDGLYEYFRKKRG
jgi:hypothetical protein